MKTNQTNRLHLKTAREELSELSNEQLRAIKLRYADARGGSYEHRVYAEADRLLLKREGVLH